MIVVTAPTGHIGSRVLADLLEHGEQVRVVARDPERLPARVRERVEVVTGSHRDGDVVERALDGAEAVFWLVPADVRAPSVYDAYVTFSIPFADAVVRHGVRHVVTVSALGRGSGLYAGHVSGSLAMEDLIRSTGVHFRALAIPSFMDNLARQVEGIRQHGVIGGTIPGDVRLPFTATRDIADLAAGLLRDRGWTGQDTLDLLGPEDLTFEEVAALASEVLGVPVRYERGDREQDRRRFVDRGFSEAMARSLIAMDVAKEHGLDNAVARTPRNTAPTSYRQWMRDVLKPAVEAG
ncbi:hypothetical protein RVR_2622 [Actinacidiphila reveromycinica]|uniref:NmrA-like domain-containing protein n=1 Tax=Actinacidiphila reveromycinica TaxID=659352 RepID=A0A7U3VMW8_9ACTN|nr:NAD(P)H-binding protein [Streptomyces sp. SN-593]BBA97055.1 hypothetical protein RVR_2622 [Streptomyces sp. SN-593]